VKTTCLYTLEERYVLRNPILPLNSFENKCESLGIDNSKLLSVFDDPIIENAFFVASRSLHQNICSIKEGNKGISKKLEMSILKYMSRMCSRSTPFGLFSGCSVGSFEDQSDIKLLDIGKHLAFEKKASDFNKNVNHSDNTKYFLNTSIYLVEGYLRFFERTIQKNQFKYSFSEVKKDSFLDEIIKKFHGVFKKDDLLELLMENGVEYNDALEYYTELYENKILVPFYKSRVSNSLDFNEVSTFNYTLRHENLSEEKNIDLFIKTSKNQLDSSIKNQILEVLLFFQRLDDTSSANIRLTNFKKEFGKRYGDKEIPLCEVFDIEKGIDYLTSNYFLSNSNILSDLNIESNLINKEKKVQFNFSQTHIILNKKIQEAYRKRQFEIILKSDDFENSEYGYQEMPNTLSAIIECFGSHKNQNIYLNAFLGRGGARLISRFGYGDSEIQDIINDLIDYEQKFVKKDEILAELIHLPSPRSNHYFKRSINTDFEIPFLGYSEKKSSEQVLVRDLAISISEKNKILLRSQSLVKTIKPILTNAHNYKNSPLPIYQFLSDLIVDNERETIGFNWGPLRSIYKYLPRVIFKRVVVSKAKWFLEIADFPNKELHGSQEFFNWQNEFHLPQMVNMVEGDKKLLLNLHNPNHFDILVHEVRKNKWIELEEFLFSESSPVKDVDGNHYANEIIVFLKKRLNAL